MYVLLFFFFFPETKISPNILSAFQVLKGMVEEVLANSAYAIINLSKLFRFFGVDNRGGNNIKSEDLEIDILPETEHIDALLELGTY